MDPVEETVKETDSSIVSVSQLDVSGMALIQQCKGHVDGVRDCLLLEDMVVSASEDCLVRLWKCDAKEGVAAVALMRKHGVAVTSLAYMGEHNGS